MKWHVEPPDRPVIPLTAVSAMVVYGIFWIWFLWCMCTLSFNTLKPPLDSGLISHQAYWVGTALSTSHMLLLAIAIVRTWQRRDSLRTAHLTGLVLAFVLMAGMQYGFERLRHPRLPAPGTTESLIETWQQEWKAGRNPLDFHRAR